ncbi:MAG: hypothetical protein QXT86_14370 [Archaeoglobaceae archaeon]
MDLLRRLVRFYGFEILLGLGMLVIAISFVFDPYSFVSMVGRKLFLASFGLVFYYIVRYVKVGAIEWTGEWRKIYAIALLIYTGLVFAFG